MTDRTAPVAATFVRQSFPNNDTLFKIARDRLRVQSGEAEAFLRWRVGTPPGLRRATTELVIRTEDTATGSWNARSVDPDQPKAYRNMGWDDRPSAVAGSADRAGAIGGDGDRQVRFDVQTDVLAAEASNEPRVAFKITCSTATRQWFVGPDGGWGWVRLVETFVEESSDPVDPTPSGIVGIPNPVFTWLAPTSLTKVQLQVDEDGGDFSVPLFDSGEVDTTTPRRDTDDGVWAGITADATVQVRAKNFTAGDGWSDWLVWEVTYIAPPAWGVTNPGATDADPTPPSVWSPDAQAFQVLSYRDDRLVHDSGLQPGPASTYTPPTGAKRAGQVLRRVHQLYDGEARESSDGDPAFREFVTETTFTPTATVAGLSTLSAVQIGRTPAIQASWTRGSVPDQVATYLDGDLSETAPGPDGSLVDWTVPPNKDLTYAGRAVVNGEHSEDALTLSLRTVVTGVWLVDPATERGCVLSGIDGLQVGYGDVSFVHTPLDGAVLLRRTLVLRDLEGSVSGLIADWPGRTRQQQYDDVMWLRERPARRLRLIMGDLNVPVVCSSLQALFDAQLTFTRDVRHDVSFTFSHAGGR